MKLTLLQCYAPTNEASEEDQEEFYEQLQAVKEKVPKHNICIIMGDFNAKVGSDNLTYESTMGKHGMGERNDNGTRLVEFCSENGMVITGTIFQHKNIHKYTWTSPDSNTNNQIDRGRVPLAGSIRLILPIRAMERDVPADRIGSSGTPQNGDPNRSNMADALATY